MAANRVVGIDLGTTYSVVAIWEKTGVKIVATQEDGLRITPSCVSYFKDELLVGEAAKKQLVKNPENTIYDMKRVIGKSSIDSVIDTSRKYWTFNLVQDPELGLSVEVNVNNETKRVSPEEISSYVLKKMKETAEKHTMSPVTKAVITVPAYFNQEQKRATVRAAELAGLEVPDLITEPAAAAYAYGFDKEQFNDYNLLVIDLGGGTFDVVIVKVKNGKFTVVAIGGDTQLGGRDFDNMLMNHMHKIILDKYQKDCFENKRTQQKLLKEVVELKHALAGATEASMYLGELFEDIDDEITITREEFNDICEDLFTKVEAITRSTINDARMGYDQINEVLMIGGSSRIVRIHELMTEIFPGKKLNNSCNPDEAVAYGAAIYAAQLSETTAKEVTEVVKTEMKLVEATPLSLGTDLFGGLFKVVIPRNSNIPFKTTVKRATVYNNQSSMTFAVLEGVRKFARDNNFLGRLKLDGIPPGPAESQIVDVTFELDRKGLLKVTAEQGDNKTELEIDFEEAPNFKPSPDVCPNDDEEDIVAAERVTSRNELIIAIEKIKYMVDNDELVSGRKDELTTLCDSMKEWLEENYFASPQQFAAKRQELKITAGC